MENKILDYLELDLNEAKTILRKKGKNIGVQQLVVKNNSLKVIQSNTIKVQIISKEGKLKLNNGFPSLGTPIQIVSTLLFLILFHFISFPMKIISAFVCGQIFALLFYYPQTNRFKAEIRTLLNQNI